MVDIFLKRIYEPADETDGARILVDRLWPRGISKETASLSRWLREIAPSNDLRKWFHHEPAQFVDFREKYLCELRTDEEKIKSMEELYEWVLQGKVTLLYGAKDPIHNHAVVLLEELKERFLSGS